MESLLTFLNQGWVGALIGVIGVGFGIYQLLHHTGPKLNYQYIGQRLIDGEEGLLPKNVVVQYDGKPVKRLSLSQIIIWNAGEPPIRGQDIVAEDPVRFCLGDDAEILSAEIVKTTRQANDSAVHIDTDTHSCLVYKFRFLDRNDGVLIRVLHTGLNTKPNCFGTIVGLPNGIQNLGRMPIQMPRAIARMRGRNASGIFLTKAVQLAVKRMNYTLIVLAAFGLVTLALAAFPSFDTLVGVSLSEKERILFAFFGVIYGPLCLVALWIDRRRFPSSLLPDEVSSEREETPTKA